MTSPAVSIRDLRKIYKSKHTTKEALKGVSLEVPTGSMFALLGPNGAGKSTLINILAGLVVKTSGSAQIGGFDIETHMYDARKRLGVVPQELVLDTFFTVREALDMHAGYYGVPKRERRTDEIIEAMGLADKADIHSRNLSGGMRRRLLIGKALVHAPNVLILDEPTAGVDVELREQLWDYVRKLNKQGTTILLTTHYLEEAEELCDDIAIINHGDLIAHENKEDLMKHFDSKQVQFHLHQPIKEVPLSLMDLGAEVNEQGDLIVHYKPSEAEVSDILTAVCAAGLTIRDVTTEQASLEEVFKHLTSGEKAAA